MSHYLMIVPEATAPAGLVGETMVGEGASYDTILPVERFASRSRSATPAFPATSATMPDSSCLVGR